MNFLVKMKFLLRKPKTVIVVGDGKTFAVKAISQVLMGNFKPGKEIIVLEADPKKPDEFRFVVNNSSLPILVAANSEEEGKTISIDELVKLTPVFGYLVLNSDALVLGEIKDSTNLKQLTFGFQEGADFRATDFIETEAGTNFKINYKGNIVPVWLEKLFGKEQIYAALSAVAVGTILDLNLIEISQALSEKT